MCKSPNKDASLKELSKDLANLMDWFRSFSAGESLAKGKSLQDQFQLGKSTMTRFYSVAYHLFTAERYQEASDALFFLTLLNPRAHKYWVALGKCEQKCRRYEAALFAYGKAMVSDYQDPEVYAHAAECYYFLNDDKKAHRALKLAKRYLQYSVDSIQLAHCIEKFEKHFLAA